MSKHFVPAMAALALLAGCTANLSGAITPGTPGTTGSTTATTGTSTAVGATVGATASGTLNPALAKLYTLGRKWEYVSTTSAPGGSGTTELREVTAVSGNIATVTSTVSGKASTSMIDLTQKDIQSATSKGADGTSSYTIDAAQTRTEKVSVTAGSFDSTHFGGTVKVTTGVANTNTTFEQWVNDTQGLLKLITKTKVDVSAALPAGIPLPAGMSLPAAASSTDVSLTIELKSFK
ncbi:MAG: hypothetical protein JWM80_542 [Cyanobacteria bacterium RYN_339]|nr:hypothetical protein [Cyanobacteria bacterium RYN_339]